jgi:tetratricopeptide (TPR) repeat protein
MRRRNSTSPPAIRPLLSRSIDISARPNPFQITLLLPDVTDPLTTARRPARCDGRLLIAYGPNRARRAHAQTRATPAPPSEVQTIEELYLTGLRIEQLYSPAFEPDPYYAEALRRDPNDYRANTALGILYCKRGRSTPPKKTCGPPSANRGAITSARKTPKRIITSAWRCAPRTNGSEAEGSHSTRQPGLPPGAPPVATPSPNSPAAAGDWSAHWNRGTFAGRQRAGLQSCIALKASILRQTQRRDEAAAAARRPWPSIHSSSAPGMSCVWPPPPSLDPSEMDRAQNPMRDDIQSYLELAVDYGNGGFYLEALELLEDAAHLSSEARAIRWSTTTSHSTRRRRAMPRRPVAPANSRPHDATDYCFPHRWEAASGPATSHRSRTGDARAPYYLGNLLYDHQPEPAIAAWEIARSRDPLLALVHRNLGLAYAAVRSDLSTGHRQPRTSRCPRAQRRPPALRIGSPWRSRRRRSRHPTRPARSALRRGQTRDDATTRLIILAHPHRAARPRLATAARIASSTTGKAAAKSVKSTSTPAHPRLARTAQRQPELALP